MAKYVVYKVEDYDTIIVEIFNECDKCEVYELFYEQGYNMFMILDRRHTKMWKRQE